jgi:hypothetical protein
MLVSAAALLSGAALLVAALSDAVLVAAALSDAVLVAAASADPPLPPSPEHALSRPTPRASTSAALRRVERVGWDTRASSGPTVVPLRRRHPVRPDTATFQHSAEPPGGAS